MLPHAPEALFCPAWERADAQHETGGAVALGLVYHALGRRVSPAELKGLMQRAQGRGDPCRANLLAQDAIRRGLQAAIVQACEPWLLLERGMQVGARLILKHRATVPGTRSQFSLVLRVDAAGAVVHDPQSALVREICRRDLLALWMRRDACCEIPAQLLVAIHARFPAPQRCQLCQAAWPGSVPCAACGQSVALAGSLLGCPQRNCAGRLWERVYCPACDCGFSELS